MYPSDPPRSSRQVRAQLADLADVRAVAEAHRDDRFSAQAQIRSLAKLEAALRRELQAADALKAQAVVSPLLNGHHAQTETARAES